MSFDMSGRHRRLSALDGRIGRHSGGAGLASNRQCRRIGQRLVYDTVPLGKAQEGGELLLGSIGIKRELQSDILKADGNLLRKSKSSTEVEITVRLERGISQFNANCRCNGVQSHPSAGHQSFEQHVT